MHHRLILLAFFLSLALPTRSLPGKRTAPTTTAATTTTTKGFKPTLPCPYKSEGEISATNTAIAELLPAGRLEEAYACFLFSLKSKSLPEEARTAIEDNARIISGALNPWSPRSRRLIHGLGDQVAPPFPPPSDPLPPAPKKDSSIWFEDGYMEVEECDAIIDLFETSDLFQGNVISGGQVIVDFKSKYRFEYDVSGNADFPPPPQWLAIDRRMVGIVIAALHRYEQANPILRTLKNPLGEEGFRMIRYTPYNASVDEALQQHTFHVDGGQEPLGIPPRVLAALIFLSEPEEGGETLFLNQGLEVKPQCGRVLIFPSAFPYVHAGRPVVAGKKYAMTLMITL